MPLYEYECDANGHRFEVIQKFSDDSLAFSDFLGRANSASRQTHIDLPHARVDEVKLTRGALPVRATPIVGEAVPVGPPDV